MTGPELIAEFKRLAKETTPGEWVCEEGESNLPSWQLFAGDGMACVATFYSGIENSEGNANFSAFAHNHADELVKYVRGLEAPLTILKAFIDNEETGDLFWDHDDETGMVIPYVNCNDVFYWATADAEEVTLDNLSVYRQCVADCKAIDNPWLASLLFVCRVNKMRPQGAYYEHIDESAWPLFDAAGPERDTDKSMFCNPTPEEKAKQARISLRKEVESLKAANAALVTEVERLRGEIKGLKRNTIVPGDSD